MEIFYGLSFMIVTIIIANFLSQAIPRVPQAFWQIFGGIILASIPGLSNLEPQLNPEWFMMLIIAPLLYYEGQKTSARIISKNFGAIVSLAGWVALLTVVILTVLGTYVVGWPMPVMLALAAIVTPTDATAFESVTGGLDMPAGIKRALNLESLFNDATGLVVLSLAMIWVNTGDFSFVNGAKEFLFVAFGGVILGLIAGFLLMFIRQHLLRSQLDDTVAHVMIYVLSPIFVYGVTEHLGVSGIIAVVVMGVFASEERHHTQFMSSTLNNLNNQMTVMISNVLNGLVFVLLGSSLVQVAKAYFHQPTHEWLGLIGIGILIYAVMSGFRFLVIFTQAQDRQIRSMVEKTGRDALIFALGGVHGSVTMAMALALPMVLSSGAHFPERNAILLIAAVVIILSLLVPLFSLPFLVGKIEPKFGMDEYAEAHMAMINAAMAYVDGSNVSDHMKQRVIGELQDQLGYGEEQLDREIWKRASKAVNEVIDDAMEAAIEIGEVSERTMIFYRRIKAHNDRKWAVSRRNVQLWFQILTRIIYMILNGFDRKGTFANKRKVKRIRERIDEQKARIKELPAPQQEKALARIAVQEQMLEQSAKTGQLTQAFTDQQQKGVEIFKEIQDVTSGALQTFVDQLEQNGEDTRFLIAVRHVIASNRGRWELREQAEEGENEVLLAALQAELTYIQNRRMRNEYSSALLKALYDEVTAAQALVLAADVDE